ncbi:hypothetical protein [Synergistes jonesii]|uniref:hypothetical protein n=1 Tax=Synergistes jonesii TaxID=2754 RepID=UPI0033334EA4
MSGRNLPLEQFKTEQSRKFNKYDYAGTKALFSCGVDPLTKQRRCMMYRIPQDLSKQYVQEAIALNLLETYD